MAFTMPRFKGLWSIYNIVPSETAGLPTTEQAASSRGGEAGDDDQQPKLELRAPSITHRLLAALSQGLTTVPFYMPRMGSYSLCSSLQWKRLPHRPRLRNLR